jgi:hypothetical protein
MAKKLKVPTSGSVETEYKVTGSGEEQYIVSRHATFERDEVLTKNGFDAVLRQVSAHVSAEPRQKPNLGK